jgi:aspartate kinase
VIVLKFGGTSVADAAAIRRAAEITRSRLDRQPVVVVSALAGTTNTLITIGTQAVEGQLISALRAVEGLRDRHLGEAKALLGGTPGGEAVLDELAGKFEELSSLAGALAVLGHQTPRSQDALAAMGEQISSILVVAVFESLGLPVRAVDPRQVIVTDDRFTRATPLPDAIARAAREIMIPLVQQGEVPVMGGFIGATEGGITTTLGRGGSDYSASLLAAALDAEVIEIWTDVDGMLTADPRVVKQARLISNIRFDEASELASFGAKVLHPNTIAPAVRRGIPVYIFNSTRPEGTGTRITSDAPKREVSAIAGKGGVTVVKVRSSRMLLQHGFLRTFFEIFERHHVSVDVVATSEVSISVTVDDTERLDALLVDLRALGDVSIGHNHAIVAIVGAGLGGHSETMGRALGALRHLAVHMVSLSASEINLTIIVDDEHLFEAMRALHRTFFEQPVPAEPDPVTA